METKRPDKRPEMRKTCPYCEAPQKMDRLHTRIYECGTKGDRDSGVYWRLCR